MKSKIIVALLITSSIYAQVPTGSPPTPYPAFNPPTTQNVANRAWYRGGNVLGGPGGGNNIFGTAIGFNSAIFTQTNGRTRTRLNGDLTTPIWGVSTNVSGYLGLSFNPGGASFFDNNTPWSMLHLDGPNTAAFSTGWRSWMRTGIYMRENTDGMYVGLKPEGGANSNRSDAIINWSDDAIGGGPDKLRFIFTESTNSGNGVGTNPRDGKSLGGYEFMRMQAMPFTNNSAGYPVGHVGIGPMFTNALPPQNRLHVNAEDNAGTFFQISNSSTTNGTGQTGLDGLHLGYPTTAANFLTAHLNQKENDNLLLMTNSGERIRISHIGNVSIPNMNPAGIANNITRVAISYNPANPITRPLSLLHIGYNTGVVSITPGSTDGWRPWMDIGTFTSNGTDHVYLGLKDEGGIVAANDRQDAVLCWGDNQVNSGLPPNNGPDNFRFIFTSTTAFSGGGTSPAIDPNGLEGMRMTPTTATGVFTGIGGDPSFNLYSGGTQNPNNTLEVNSWGTTLTPGGSSGLRFTNLNTTSPTLPANPGPGVLTVNATGDVIYVPANSGTGIGNYCSATTPNPLTGDYEIPMNIYNYYFSGQGTGRTNVGVGLPCATQLGAKLHAYQLANNFFLGSNLGVSVAGRFDNYTATNAFIGYGVVGNSQAAASGYNIGVYGEAAGAAVANFAGYFQGDVFITGNTTGVGTGTFSDKNIKTNIASIGKSLDVISKLKPINYKYDNTYATQLKLNGHKNYGFIAQDVEAVIPELVTTTTVIATYDSLGNVIDPEKVVKALNYDGIIPFAVGGIQELNVKQQQMQEQLDKAGLSDVQIKTNLNNFNALAKIKTLNPVSYNFTNANVPQLSFKPATDYGFVAQQLETVYPELVDTVNVPASYDSLGNMVNVSKTLKTVNYKAMTALLARSIQEQQLTIDSLRSSLSKQDSINQAVQQQLNNLSNLINSCCSNNSRTSGNSIQNQLDVELSDKDAIVLNQNVPNPFAEQTTISYNVPQSVSKAQLLFYNDNGQLIQSVEIKTRGKGKVNVFASDLSSGLYHYTLVADGKVIDSKKMVRE